MTSQQSNLMATLTSTEPGVQAAYQNLCHELNKAAQAKKMEADHFSEMSDRLLALALQEGVNNPEEFPELPGKLDSDDDDEHFTEVKRNKRR